MENCDSTINEVAIQKNSRVTNVIVTNKVFVFVYESGLAKSALNNFYYQIH